MTLWKTDRFASALEYVPSRFAIGGSVSDTTSGDIHRTATLDCSEVDRIDPDRCYFVPELTVIKPDGTKVSGKLGLFLATHPKTTLTSASYTGSVEGKGITYLLQQAALGGMTLPAGKDTGEAAREIAIEAGFLSRQLNMPDTGFTIADAYPVKAGSRALAVINDLYQLSGWYPIQMTNDLMLTARKKPVLENAPATHYYSTQTNVVEVLPGIESTPDTSDVKNTVIVVNSSPARPEGWEEGDPEPEPIWARARITNPSHPYYYNPDSPSDSFPYEIAADPIENNEITSSDQAYAIAVSELSHMSMTQRIRMTTVADPTLEINSIVNLDIRRGSKEIYTGNWLCISRTINIAGMVATMDVELMKTESIL